MKRLLAYIATRKCSKLQKEFYHLWWDDKPEGMGTAQARWNNRQGFENLANKLHFYCTSLERLGAIDKRDVIDQEGLKVPEGSYANFRLMQARLDVIPWSTPLETLDSNMRNPGAIISENRDDISMS